MPERTETERFELNGTRTFKTLRSLACAACLPFMGAGTAVRADDAGANTGPAAALHARYTALKAELDSNPFHRPLHMDSREGPDGVTGEINALVNHPFATVGAALGKATPWCDILILHLNTKYCRPSIDDRATVLHLNIGKKYDQPVVDAYRLDLVYRVAAATPTYLQVKLDADEGPLGTRNYRMMLEAVPAEGNQTFIRFSYAYSYGMVGRIAMQSYLGTIGRNKVGFTVLGTDPDGQPRYIGGMRGVVERNTMRYYLAIEAFLGALSAPPPVRVEKSLNDWFAAIERYPRQLHEMERSDYLDMKRREYSRQQVQALASRPPFPGAPLTLR